MEEKNETKKNMEGERRGRDIGGRGWRKMEKKIKRKEKEEEEREEKEETTGGNGETPRRLGVFILSSPQSW